MDPHRLLSITKMPHDAPAPWGGRIAVAFLNLRNGVTNVLAVDETLTEVAPPSGMQMLDARALVDEHRTQIEAWLNPAQAAAALAPRLAKSLRRCARGAAVPWSTAPKSHRLLNERGYVLEGDGGTETWAVISPLGKVVEAAL